MYICPVCTDCFTMAADKIPVQRRLVHDGVCEGRHEAFGFVPAAAADRLAEALEQAVNLLAVASELFDEEGMQVTASDMHQAYEAARSALSEYHSQKETT